MYLSTIKARNWLAEILILAQGKIANPFQHISSIDLPWEG
jgi:hypothetical protein